MRGQRIFDEIIKGPGIGNTLRRGRNNSLLHKRNECMLARYYYWGTHKNKTYEDILRQLMTEFYLSPATIATLIQNNSEQLVVMKQKAPSIYFMQMRWPHLKW
ncbi:MAG: hypothetical protein V4649_04210 [Bacteroidota bacterium]